jgi:surface protein
VYDWSIESVDGMTHMIFDLNVRVQPKTTYDLQKIIRETIEIQGFNCDLNFIDVSNIEDMSSLFHESEFNGDISKWDVSNVTDMYAMFSGSKFNGDISKWNVSKVTNMRHMFYKCSLEENTPEWY